MKPFALLLSLYGKRVLTVSQLGTKPLTARVPFVENEVSLRVNTRVVTRDVWSSELARQCDGLAY